MFADAGYGTHKKSNAVDPAFKNYKNKGFGAHIYSKTGITITNHLLDWKINTLTATLKPLYFAPYEQYIGFSSHASQDTDYSLYLAGYRDFRLFEFSSSLTKNTKTFKVSYLDYLEGLDDLIPSLSDFKFISEY